ncbi:MAG: hypothetical protein J2P36_22075 [Ktedonobacteraceae bacterium]|nr:hypothetical protein [Ktedonobacteraceae bacterium]
MVSKKWTFAIWAVFLMVLIGAVVGGVMVRGGGRALAVFSASATYDDYSSMTQRRAGQYWADDQAAGQWAWNPQSGGESRISWGDPAKWPPNSYEKFIHQEDWVMLDGWTGNGTYYKENVGGAGNGEWIGDATCKNLVPLPSSGGRQHYVKWTIPAQAYCLIAKGTITEESSGKILHFEHQQIWSPPSPCSNQYYQNQTCITQHERWSDDNGHPFQLTLDRSVQIARGLGMAFTIHQTFPSSWQAELRYHWSW